MEAAAKYDDCRENSLVVLEYRILGLLGYYLISQKSLSAKQKRLTFLRTICLREVRKITMRDLCNASAIAQKKKMVKYKCRNDSPSAG